MQESMICITVSRRHPNIIIITTKSNIFMNFTPYQGPMELTFLIFVNVFSKIGLS